MKTLLTLVLLFTISSCSLREREGEDLKFTNKAEAKAFLYNINYVKDSARGLCFAVLNNATDGYRNTFTFSEVSCKKVGL